MRTGFLPPLILTIQVSCDVTVACWAVSKCLPSSRIKYPSPRICLSLKMKVTRFLETLGNDHTKYVQSNAVTPEFSLSILRW